MTNEGGRRFEKSSCPDANDKKERKRERKKARKKERKKQTLPPKISSNHDGRSPGASSLRRARATVTDARAVRHPATTLRKKTTAMDGTVRSTTLAMSACTA